MSYYILDVAIFCLMLNFVEIYGDCRDLTLYCPLDGMCVIGMCWQWIPPQCQTCHSVTPQCKNQCGSGLPRTCNLDAWAARADGCSIPVPGLNYIWNQVFHSACDIHDLCYAAPNAGQGNCDNEFYQNMLRICSAEGIGTLAGHHCTTSASIIYAAVVAAGGPSYNSGQEFAELNCRDPDPVCPSGFEQVDQLGAAIMGCGLEECGSRLQDRYPNIDTCAAACNNRVDCKSFTWAPLNDDPNVDSTVCSLYNTDTTNGHWGRGQQITCRKLVCPLGSLQIGGLNADIAGGGLLDRNWNRYNVETIEDCQNKCNNREDCFSFSWAPMGGDKHHVDSKVCSVYDRFTLNQYWGPNQILCSRQAQLIKSHLPGDKCLDVHYDASLAPYDSPAQIWPCHGGSNQQWYYRQSTHELVSVANGKCLDIYGGQGTQGATIGVFECWGGDNQKWIIDPSGAIISEMGGCLDISNHDRWAWYWECWEGPNQLWFFSWSNH